MAQGQVAEQAWRRFEVEYTLAGMAVLLHRIGKPPDQLLAFLESL